MEKTSIRSWVGANTEAQARAFVEAKHPELKAGTATLKSLKQSLSGMWSYEIESKKPSEEQKAPAEEAEMEPPPQEEGKFRDVEPES